MLKTIREWSEELPEPARTRFVTNLEVVEDSNPDELAEHLHTAVLGGFSWEDSKEGAGYWNRLWKHLLTEGVSEPDHPPDRMLEDVLRRTLIAAGVLCPDAEPTGPELLAAAEDFINWAAGPNTTAKLEKKEGV
jgi:hypothetical protein